MREPLASWKVQKRGGRAGTLTYSDAVGSVLFHWEMMVGEGPGLSLFGLLEGQDVEPKRAELAVSRVLNFYKERGVAVDLVP
jgi:hypothetical protein